MKRYRVIVSFVLVMMATAVCSVAKGDKNMSYAIKSSAFGEGMPIPKEYTCEGKSISPDLSWSGAPSNTKSFVLICDDPDAPHGTWTHWIVYDIPLTTTSFAAGVKTGDELEHGIKQGSQSSEVVGYQGPCPPPGHGKHRYYFTLYAMDCPSLGIKGGANRKQVEEAMGKHIISKTQYMGTYERK
jgi:Raf kinase inhibitor-like YbhB/YbcL family protein